MLTPLVAHYDDDVPFAASHRDGDVLIVAVQQHVGRAGAQTQVAQVNVIRKSGSVGR